MGNIERYYTPEEVVSIAGKRSMQDITEGLKVFKVALRKYGFDVVMPKNTDAQWAYYRAISSVFAAGYIQGKQDERRQRRGGKIK